MNYARVLTESINFVLSAQNAQEMMMSCVGFTKSDQRQLFRLKLPLLWGLAFYCDKHLSPKGCQPE